MKSPWCIPIVALFRSCTLDGIPELLSYYLALLPTPIEPSLVDSSRALTFLHVGIRRTRKSRGGEEGRDEQMPAEVEPARGEETRGGREEGKKDRTQQCPRRCILARLPTRGAEGGPPLTGFVNHGRFKVITRRKKRELMAVVEPRCCRQEARRKRVEGEETGPVGRPSPIDRLIYSGSIFHRKDENAQPHWLPTLAG